MNYLQRKKLAFMKLLDNIKTVFGYPVVIQNAKESNAVDYTIYGNTEKENLLTYPFVDSTKTVSGITFTDNGDGTITANGTATADARFILKQSMDIPKYGNYFLSGCPEGGGTSKYYLHANAAKNGGYVKGFFDEGQGIAVDLSIISYDKISVIAITIKSGITADNMVFEPKLISSKYAVTKTVNRIPYPYFDSKRLNENGTRVVNGITYTDNKDGTITANGTATGTSYFYATSADSFNLDNKKYTLSGCPHGGSAATYYTYISAVNGKTFVKSENDTGNGATIDFTDSVITGTTIGITIKQGVTVNNLVFKLCLTEYGNEYEPPGYKIPLTIDNGTETKTVNVYRISQLAEGESINYKTDNLPALPLNEGYNEISAETDVKPEKIDIRYESR